jgi:hypothetical protein
MVMKIYSDEHGDYCLVPLTQGQFAKVSPSDFDFIVQWKWFARFSKKSNSYEARRTKSIAGTKIAILMHREIVKVSERLLVDHKNHDTLDNRRSNLRPATHSQNQQNKRASAIFNTSGFKGVSWHKASGSWRATICVNKKCKHLGLFSNPEDASRKYKEASATVHGEFGCTEMMR